MRSPAECIFEKIVKGLCADNENMGAQINSP